MQIENFREGRQYDKDQAHATFDVYHNGSRYIDLRLMRSKSGHFFINYPCKLRQDPQGNNFYIRIYDWGKEKNDIFNNLVMEALRPFISEMERKEEDAYR